MQVSASWRTLPLCVEKQPRHRHFVGVVSLPTIDGSLHRMAGDGPLTAIVPGNAAQGCWRFDLLFVTDPLSTLTGKTGDLTFFGALPRIGAIDGC